MNFGITITSCVPIRKEPAEQSEMTSQLLFGELFEISEKRNKWILIKTVFDNYQGWVDPKTIKLLDENQFEKLKNSPCEITKSVITQISAQGSIFSTRIFPGSELYNLKKDKFSFADQEFTLDSQLEKNKGNQRDNLILYAKQFINAPYIWGGRTPFGIDCSGLTQVLYKIAGIPIHRDARKQVIHGHTISFINEAKPGDLAFFDNEKGEIIHVGMIFDEGKIIHASGRVRIDKIDHQGIYNEEIRQYSHKLRVIQQIIQ
jgi:cell wall-associated NlpC family hydrolase